MFVDGEPGAEYNARGLGGLTFSPDGPAVHTAYVVQWVEENDKDVSFVVLDGVEGPRCDKVFWRTLQFGPDHSVTFVGQRGLEFYRVTQSYVPWSTE